MSVCLSVCQYIYQALCLLDILSVDYLPHCVIRQRNFIIIITIITLSNILVFVVGVVAGVVVGAVVCAVVVYAVIVECRRCDGGRGRGRGRPKHNRRLLLLLKQVLVVEV